MQYTAINLIKRPKLEITPDLFEIVTRTTPALQDRQILIKQTHMSLDPAMKGWMMPDRNSYIPPVELGEVMRSSGVGEVIESKHPQFAVGTQVSGMLGWAEYAVNDGVGINILPTDVTPEAMLCVLGIPGLTAYQGLINIAKAMAGETIVVSGAAGSVGSLVGQIAKAEGLYVIGTAGSNDKCKWLTDELGFDMAINYKSENVAKELAAAAPKGVDIYFENTGGPVQHAVFNLMNAHGRIVVCGLISDYNTRSPMAGPNWLPVVLKRLTIQGFTLTDHHDEAPHAMRAISTYLREGKIKYRAHTLHGLESAIEGINLLFTGGNTGKLLVQL